VGALEASVTTGESGPVVVLSGEADLMSAGQLSEILATHLSGGTRQLTIDVSGLRFADSASIRALVLAGKTLRDRGGTLVLVQPRPPVARVLELTGADALLAIEHRPP
jgi:anti-sigma B factor antagonist